MQPTLDLMVNHLKETIAQKEGGMIRPRIIITISGIPGSGKTTLALALAEALNAQVGDEGVEKHFKTAVISMDGFHYPRSQLDEEGTRRRGAPFTFDAPAVVQLVERLRMSTYRQLPDILAPSFDHAIKDPVVDDVSIVRSTNIVILEGNYLLLKDDPWNKIRDLVDESWLLLCDFNVAEERLAKRHLAAGLVQTLEAGIDRVRFNDMPNGRYLLENSLPPTIRITQ
ncbi:Putative uncharacterized protein [Taphrina deformans PYCC 5710]|uniref:Phosphoribulokinase/uridine kinase domain-containing protein n=1 Tax=Taphrina deformans (strain PYCC 5710 / ATCC 11124 / CBS 356.35 / IMI 108563 / JCM 9778 / NBRC 8474) TaxID=1097556 RepID=R4XEL1_TAPDE|nr:Putative uncharacterized protein [Taphrina deformans PYCC 5710]|eukprot:CCG82911.1 Putative uncharacterized protein [Taphrina deformans PYCC 5710]